MSRLKNIADKIDAQSTRRVTVISDSVNPDGVLEVHIRINDPERGNPEYVYYFRDPPEDVLYKIRHDRIHSYPQLRDVAQHAFEYKRVGEESESEDTEQMKQRSLEHVKEILKSLRSK